MRKFLALLLVAVMAVSAMSVVAAADYFTPGDDYCMSLGGPYGLPNWYDIAETGPA